MTPHKETLEMIAEIEAQSWSRSEFPVNYAWLVSTLKREIEVNMIAEEALAFYAAALEAKGTEALIEREINGGEFIRIGTTARHALDKIKQVRSKDGT